MGLFDMFKKKESVVQPKAVTPVSEIKTETHKVVGTDYYTKDLLTLAAENNAYKFTKNDIIKNNLIGRKIYQYYFKFNNVSLVPEPTNQVDPNAVMVLLDGKKVGYIKKGSCSHIKKLLSENSILSIKANIHGGSYKAVHEEGEIDGKPEYEFDKGKDHYFVDLTLTLK